MARRIFATGLSSLLLLAGLAGSADARSLEPSKPSELVYAFAGGGDCPCLEGAKALIQFTGIDGRIQPLALGNKQAMVLTGGTINVFSVPAGEEHLVSIILFGSSCEGGVAVEQRLAVADESGVSVTDFDFDFGLAINAEAILCVRAAIGPDALDAQGRFRGFRTKNK